MSLSCTSNSHRVSFSSIKPTVRVCESAMKEFSQEFPMVGSSTRLKMDMAKRSNVLSGTILWKKLQIVYEDLVERSFETRYLKRCSKSEDKLKAAVKETNVANCGEQAALLKNILSKKGKDAQQVEMEFVQKIVDAPQKLVNNHSFLLLDAKKGANYTDPKTWGSKAVIADPWSKTIKPAFEMLEEYNDKFHFDPNKELINFQLS